MKNLPAMIFFTILFSSCSQNPHTRAEIDSAISHYDSLLKGMNADSISLLFTPDGSLAPAPMGRDSIRKFLAAFKNVQVLAVSTASDSVSIHDDTAFQKGTFRQTALIDKKDTVHAKGTYRAVWIWVPNEGWRIKKMDTQSKP